MSILPIIQQAVLAGFGEDKILDFISNKLPKLASGISKAKQAGYDPVKILRFLSYNAPKNKKENIEKQMSQNDQYLKGIGQKTKGEREEQRNKFLKGALGVGAGALALNTYLDLPKQTAPTPPAGPQPMGGAPVQPQQGPNLGMPAQIPAQGQALAPQQPNLGAQTQIPTQGTAQPQPGSNLLSFTQDPEFKAFVQRKIDTGTEGPLEEMVKEFKAEKKKSPMMKGIMEQAEKMKKSDFITPAGDVGTLKSERNGKTLIDVNGKLEQFDKKDLEAPRQELFDVVEGLLDLPEHEKSSVISSLIYRPKKNEMFVKYHNGETYVYEGVSEDEISPIAEAMGIPVTSGQSVYGAWEKGKQDSRGAALIAGIIRSPRYSKKEEGQTWAKLETKYDRHKKIFKQPKRKRLGEEEDR